MKLIVLYGPPAVGKLTVAEELAKQTGYKLFHNHLTIDIFESVFEYGTDIFWELLEETRMNVFKEAAKQNINVITTLVYVKGEDDEYMQKMKDIVEAEGGEVCFVQLKSSVEELKKRLVSESRKKYNKMKKVESLERMLKRDILSAVPFENNIIIDNTNLTVEETVGKIVEYFNL